GIATPAKKEPKRAWMPIISVTKAQAKRKTTTAAMTPLPGAADSRAAWPSQRGTRGFIQKSITATNSRTRTMVRTAGAKPPALTMATTKASTVQAVTSSVAAHARAVLPKAVLVKPRSSRMRARTGKAVMLIEMPIKSAKARKVVPGTARLGKSQSEANTPSRYGKRMLTWL